MVDGLLSKADYESQLTTKESYERVPYKTFAWENSRPEQLQAIAYLNGMSPKNVDECCVLELGCGDGSNIIPMAVAHPGSTFIGVDISLSHIRVAQQRVEQLGLNNIRFESVSFVELNEIPGTVDYIIAHGLLSWDYPIVTRPSV